MTTPHLDLNTPGVFMADLGTGLAALIVFVCAGAGIGYCVLDFFDVLPPRRPSR